MLPQNKIADLPISNSSKKSKQSHQKNVPIIENVKFQEFNNKNQAKTSTKPNESRKSSRGKSKLRLIEQQEQKFRKNNITKLITADGKSIKNDCLPNKVIKIGRLRNLKSLKLETDCMLNMDDFITQQQLLFEQNLLNKIIQSDHQDSPNDDYSVVKEQHNVQKNKSYHDFAYRPCQATKIFKRAPRLSSNLEEVQSKIRRHKTMASERYNQQGFLPEVKQFYRMFRDQKLLNDNYKKKNKSDAQLFVQNLKTSNIGVPLKLGLLGGRGTQLTLNQSDKYFSGDKMLAIAKGTKVINPKYCNFSANSINKEAAKKLFQSLPSNTQELKLQKSFHRNSSALKEISILKNSSIAPNMIADSLQLQSKKQIGNFLKVLDLSKNRITDQIYNTELSKTIRNKMQYLQKLNLSQNYLTWKSSAQLNYLLHSKTIRYLNLRWNKLSAKGCKQLLSDSQHDIKLFFLDLSWNYLGTRHIKIKIQQRQHFKNEERQQNHANECTQQIINVISHHTNLCHFDISNNHFSKQECLRIIQAFNRHQSQNLIGFHFQGHFNYFLNCFGRIEEAENDSYCTTIPIVQNYREFQHPDFCIDQTQQRQNFQKNDKKIAKQHRRVKSKSLLSFQSKNSLSANQFNAQQYNSIKQTDKGLFQVKKFQEQVCWVCDKWRQKQFVFQLYEQRLSDKNGPKSSSVFVHFDFAGWRPLKMSETTKIVTIKNLQKNMLNKTSKKQQARSFKLKLMVPQQKEIQYFFAYNAEILLDQSTTIKRISKIIQFNLKQSQLYERQQGKINSRNDNRIDYQAFIQYCNAFEFKHQSNQAVMQNYLPCFSEINPYKNAVKFMNQTTQKCIFSSNKWLFRQQQVHNCLRMSKMLTSFKLPKAIASIMFPFRRQKKRQTEQNNLNQGKSNLNGLYHHSSMLNSYNYQHTNLGQNHNKKSLIDDKQTQNQPQLLPEYQIFEHISKKIQLLQDTASFEMVLQYENLEHFQEDYFRQDSLQKSRKKVFAGVSNQSNSDSSLLSFKFKQYAQTKHKLNKENKGIKKVNIQRNQIKRYKRVSIDIGQSNFLNNLHEIDYPVNILSNAISENINQIRRRTEKNITTRSFKSKDKQCMSYSYLHELPSVSMKRSILTAIQENDYEKINDLIKHIKPKDKNYAKFQLQKKFVALINQRNNQPVDFPIKLQNLQQLDNKKTLDISSIIRSILFKLITIDLKLNKKVIETIVSKVIQQCSSLPISLNILFKLLFRNVLKIFFIQALLQKLQQQKLINENQEYLQMTCPIKMNKQSAVRQHWTNARKVDYGQLLNIFQRQQQSVKGIVWISIEKIYSTLNSCLTQFLEKQQKINNTDIV